MASNRPAFPTDLLLIIVLAFGTFGCSGISSGPRSGGGGGGGGSNPPPSVQLWSDILDPSRATDWTKAGIQGGIPKRTTICRTVSLTAGRAAAAANATAIQNAIAACAGTNEVVMIPAGTWYTNGFYISGNGATALYNNVTLRGAGPNQTILLIQSTVACYAQADVCIGGNGNSFVRFNGAASWTGDNGAAGTYSKGDSIIDVGTWTGTAPNVGDIIILDQRDDSIGICPASGGAGACSGVQGLVESGNTVTVTTSLPHGFAVGSPVNVGGVSSPCPPSGCPAGQTTQWVGYVNTMSWSGGTVTMTFVSYSSIQAGDTFWVSGVNPPGYNGVYTAATVSGQDVTYSLASNPGTYVSGGLVYDPIMYTGQWTVSAVWSTSSRRWNSTAGFSDPNSTQFRYVSPVSGLAAGGGGMASVDNGGFYVSCLGGPTCSSQGGSGFQGAPGRHCPLSNFGSGGTTVCATGEFSYRPQHEVKRITAINGSQITIDPPLENPNWRTSQNPGVYFLGTGAFVTGDSIEAMTIDGTNDGCGAHICGLVNFADAYESWAKNIRTINGHRNHFWISIPSARINIVDSYMFGSPGASKSYGVELSGSDNVIQNTICQHVVSCLMVAGDTGSVYGYNYAVDSGYQQPGINIALYSLNHDNASYELFEGGDGNKIQYDNVHGPSDANTVFRSRLPGQDTPGKMNYLTAAESDAYNRIDNYIGNVLGLPGVQTKYWSNRVGASGYIYNMDSGNGGTPNDSVTTQSSLRWGNYDVVTGATRWCGTGGEADCDGNSEIPTTGVAFVNGNPVPASHNLPPSFYLSAQPEFWIMAPGYGPTPPWPAIGPDVSGGTAPDGVAGYSYAIPAQLCYINTPVDPSYQRVLGVSAGTWGNGTVEGQATLTTSSNTLSVGDVVRISGIRPSGYNGIYQVISATSTSVTVYMSNNPGTYESGGIITYPNILNFNATNCYQNE